MDPTHFTTYFVADETATEFTTAVAQSVFPRLTGTLSTYEKVFAGSATAILSPTVFLQGEVSFCNSYLVQGLVAHRYTLCHANFFS